MYHMNVFEWMFDNYGDRTNDHDFFIDCEISNKIKITYFLISHGLLPISYVKIDEWSNDYDDALDFANKNRSNEVASILKELPRSIVSKEDNKKSSTSFPSNLFRT